jgi:thioredoxin reductase (NADPH)
VSSGRQRAIETSDKTAGFLMLGAAPNNKWLSGALDVDDEGFVLTGDSVGHDEPPLGTS